MLGRLFRRARTLARRDRVDDEIRRELEFHIAMETAERERRGLPPTDARRSTLRDFGGVAAIREAVRDARGMTFWDSASQDVRFAMRTLGRWRGFTVGTVATLALGIGANTAIFTIVNDVLLQPLPYRAGKELVRLRQSSIKGPGEVGISISEVRDYRAAMRSLDEVVEYHSMSFVLLNHGEPDRVRTGVVSAEFFEAFGVRPAQGRGFTAADEAPGAPAVLVLSHEYWTQRFGADPSVVGRVVQMNDRPHTVVGVLPRIPQYPRENDVYMPTSACPFRAAGERQAGHDRRAFAALQVFGRLRPGVTVEGADHEAAMLARRFADADPEAYKPSVTGFHAGVVALEDEMILSARPILLGLLGTTALVLLIACANVANLSLSRMARRDREMAVRLALGAGRARLARQLLTESSILACAGGSLGLLVAWASLDLLAAFAARFTPRVIDPALDGGVLVFTLVLTLIAGLLFGIVPALSAKPTVTTALMEGSAQSGDGVQAGRIRSALVITQVAVCFALLVGAGLLLENVRRLASVDLGYRADRVLTAEVYGNWSQQTSDEDLRRFYAALLDRLRAIPGIISAAITNGVPLTELVPGERPVRIDGHVRAEPTQFPLADQSVASDGYFETLGIPLVAGRLFTPADHQGAPSVAVINQSMARLWGRQDPLGTRFQPVGSDQWITVIGVVADVRQYSMERAGLAQYYTPFLQTPGIAGRILLRTDGEPLSFAAALKAAVYSVHPDVPVEAIQTLESLRVGRLAAPGLNAALLAVFAGVALLITLAGIAAVVGTTVTRRTREFGVRMALGASRSSLMTMVLRQGMMLTVAGLLGGVAGAAALNRVVAANLYETTPTDPAVYAIVAALFMACAAVACLGPARRATGIDPLSTLKGD
ncbi:MAG TPA: ABC transporter permease [Vicinamibacterales bacterium]|nr:ABC transporter permease [Vicinamibacterales bacterium]